MPKTKKLNRKSQSVVRKNEEQPSSDAIIKLKMLEAELKDKMKIAYKTLENMKREKLNQLDFIYRTALMRIPKSVLESKFDPDDEEFVYPICNKEDVLMMAEEIENIPATPATITRTVKRRSRSASNLKTSPKLLKIRSSSIDVYKTPKGRVRLSSLMSSKKYTVSKPKKPENSGLHVKRIMKPDEEAISTCGSPLYVAPSTLVVPQVNIPLPGGVVLNIEPKESKGPLEVPGLDLETKRQVKILCEHLKKLF